MPCQRFRHQCHHLRLRVRNGSKRQHQASRDLSGVTTYHTTYYTNSVTTYWQEKPILLNFVSILHFVVFCHLPFQIQCIRRHVSSISRPDMPTQERRTHDGTSKHVNGFQKVCFINTSVCLLSSFISHLFFPANLYKECPTCWWVSHTSTLPLLI